MPQLLAQAIMQLKTAYSGNLSKSMIHLVHNMQEADNKARKLHIKIAEKGVHIIDDSP